MRVLFDDSIDPEVFSSSAEAALGSMDRRIAERIRSSAFLVPVVVITITDGSALGEGQQLELELMPSGDPIHGQLAPYFQPNEPIKLRIGGGSVGYALARSNQGELVGKRLNLCWNRFAEASDAVDHWHAFSDSPKTKAAIAKAAAIVSFE
jgi:hypothetical protein